MNDANEALRALDEIERIYVHGEALIERTAIIRSHLSDPGYVRVPVEPTPRMLDALYNFIPEKYATQEGEKKAYKSMLAAAQGTSHD